MTPAHPPSFDLVDRTLQDLGSVVTAPEVHGGLCGLACVLGAVAPAVWVAQLSSVELQPECRDPGADAVLGKLADAACAALTEGDMSFAPLLPPDDRPLAVRTQALANWCSGFMNGLGQGAASRPTLDLTDSEITREILEDFSEITRAIVGETDTDAEAEAAYVELVEFVRVSVQLVFEELYAARKTPRASEMQRGIH